MILFIYFKECPMLISNNSGFKSFNNAWWWRSEVAYCR